MDILRLEWFDVPFKVSTSDNHNNIATKSQPVHTYKVYKVYIYKVCWQLTYNVAFYPVKIFDIPYKMLLTIKRFWSLISVLSFTKKYPESDKIPSNGSCILMWLRLRLGQFVMLHIFEQIPAQFNLLGCEDWHNNQFSHPLFLWEIFQRHLLSQTTCPRSCRSPSLPGNCSATQSSEGALRVLGPRPLCWRLLLLLW